MVRTAGCDACNKSSLSLLLLRPSPLAKSSLLDAPGTRGVAADPAVITGLLPEPLPTQSRFALRLLRAGYVHVYIANPPAGVKNWLIYRVTHEADLIPESHALFAQRGSPITCIRTDHIATGTKLLSIPQAHKLSEIWIAYSANLWNDVLREKNKADPAVMQKISLQQAGPNTFVPSAQKLKAQVLECAVSQLTIDGSDEQDFVFNSLSKKVDELASGLKNAAAKHPKTVGKEIAVVLRDPIAIATELNSLRLRRNELIKKEFSKPEIVHPLNSSRAVAGLKQSLVDEADASSYDQITPLISLEEYQGRKWAAGTYPLEVTQQERAELLSGKRKKFLMPLRRQQLIDKVPMVWVIFPDIEERAQAWTERVADQNWSKFSRYHDEEEQKKWVDKFNARMKQEHYTPLQEMESDWFNATQDKQTLTYFKRHFDSASRINNKNPGLDSLIYSQESHLIHQPAPLTAGAVAERYVAMLDKAINDEAAVVLRAMVGNRQSMFGLIHEQLTGDPGSEGMRDKTFDILKGFSELTRSRPAMQSYGWLGHALALYSVGQMSALTGAVLSVAAAKAKQHPATASAIGKLQSLMIVQRALEIAVKGALKGNAPKLPVLIKMSVDAEEALTIMAARAGQDLGISKSRIKKHRTSGRRVTLTLLTDTDAIKAASGELSEVTRDGTSGTVKMGTLATRAATASVAGKTTVLSKEAFLELYQRQLSTAGRASNLLRDALPSIARTSTGSNLMELSKTLDARLALASMVIQAIGIWNGLQGLRNAESSSAKLDARYGLADSVIGFSGGALQLGALYAEIRLSARAGHQAAAGAVARSIGIGALKILGSATGVAGGGINFVASLKKQRDQLAIGNDTAAQLYRLSAIASLGTAISSAGLTLGGAASMLEARAVGGAVVRTVATRLAGNAVLATVGGVGLTVSGIGLVLLGAGVAFQVGAILLTPTDFERWLSRSYFGCTYFGGKRDDRFAHGDWTEERNELEKVLAPKTN